MKKHNIVKRLCVSLAGVPVTFIIARVLDIASGLRVERLKAADPGFPHTLAQILEKSGLDALGFLPFLGSCLCFGWAFMNFLEYLQTRASERAGKQQGETR